MKKLLATLYVALFSAAVHARRRGGGSESEIDYGPTLKYVALALVVLFVVALLWGILERLAARSRKKSHAEEARGRSELRNEAKRK